MVNIQDKVQNEDETLCFFKKWVMRNYSTREEAKKSQFCRCYRCDGHDTNCGEYLIKEE